MGFAISFITSFMIKYFTRQALEKVVLILLKKLVECTESKVDDEMYRDIFEKFEEGKKDEIK